MTKIGDKLQRLHGSRVRALDSNKRHEGVFIADVEEIAKPVQKTHSDHKFASVLRNQTLKGKSQNKRPQAATEFGAYKLRPQPITDSGPAHEIGERVKDLRIQASALIDAGRNESALPLLFEIVAFAPENSFALAKLKTHFERRGQVHLAIIFEKRLKKIANY